MRRGFTLIEVLLVLCLVAMVAAMSWPLLTHSFEQQRLRTAADRVRTAWVRARTQAMDSGCVQTFRYTTGGGRFQVQQQADVLVAANDVASQGSTAAAPAGNGSRTTGRSGELPEGITFVTSQIESDARAQATDTSAQSDSGDDTTLREGESDWSDPILFYPDGTATAATVRLRNSNGRCIELSLRGLTGVVTQSDILADNGGLP